ncbi:3-deoxy-D-manno-octulosonic acid transferase [Desulfomarina sp.]
MRETFLFRLVFLLYRFLWSCAIPFLLHSRRLKEGSAERTLKNVLFSRVDLWIHAASAGEAYLAGQLVGGLEVGRTLDILITTNTFQGKEILKKVAADRNHRVTVAYMVFDSPALVRRAVKIADPKLLILIELEIWPALLAEIVRVGRKYIIVNGRMTEKSYGGYKRIGFLWKRLKPAAVLAISENDRARFADLFDLGPERALHVPNLKFDRIGTCRCPVEHTEKQKMSLVLASVGRDEEEDILFLIKALLEKFPGLLIHLFPRHMHRVQGWMERLEENNISWVLQSSKEDTDNFSVVIRDVFGELVEEYRRANSVFVGGSLAPIGGQNFMEAFMNGVVPVTGPFLSDFSWVGEEVFREGLVKMGNNREDVLDLLVESLENPVDKAAFAKKVNRYIVGKQGGTEKTCEFIKNFLKES